MSDKADGNRTAPQRFASWNAYWTARGKPWRKEAEIDKERQEYLAQRRMVKPKISEGLYAFRDENGCIRLTRADVEWLLVTHENGIGPVYWENEKDKDSRLRRRGIDLRGANLQSVDLSRLPLACLVASLTNEEWEQPCTNQAQRELATVRLEGANLNATHLEYASLRGAHLEKANLRSVHLEKASLAGAHLAGANLSLSYLQGAYFGSAHFEGKAMLHEELGEVRNYIPDFPDELPGAKLRMAYLDQGTDLYRATLGHPTYGSVSVVDARWGGTNLARTKGWPQVLKLGDEPPTSHRFADSNQSNNSMSKLRRYQIAVRANRQVASELRAQGMNEYADHFAFRAQLMQREVFHWNGQWGNCLVYWFLYLVSGYGYQLLRILATYLIVLLVFTCIYWGMGVHSFQHEPSWRAALDCFLVSLSAIHGRATFEQLGAWSPAAWWAAVESVFGIVIEGVFVAMLIQRFFTR